MDYQKKYLKYKSKYLNLKKQYGGMNIDINDIKYLADMLNKIGVDNKLIYIIVDSYNLTDDYKLLNNLYKDKGDYKEVMNIINNTIFSNIDNINDNYILLKNKVDNLKTKDEFIKKICKEFNNILNKLTPIVEKIISNNTTINFTQLIDNGIKENAIDIINIFIENYKNLPKNFSDMIENPQELENKMSFIVSSLNTLLSGQKLINSIPLNPFSKISKKLTNTNFNVFIEYLKNNKKDISQGINKSIILFYFIINFIKDYC
jgi:hypothetical protein